MGLFATSIIFTLLVVLSNFSSRFIWFRKKASSIYVFNYENVLGTSLELKVRCETQKAATLAECSALNEVIRLSKILSSYDSNSEFSRWLRTTNTPVIVSSELIEVLDLFDLWRLRTAGAINPSAQLINELWMKASATGCLPTSTDLASAVDRANKQHWVVDKAALTATHLSLVPISLNSFTKIYIMKRALNAAIAKANIKAIVINIGGDLIVSGDFIDNVQISDPKADAENDLPLEIISVQNQAVATSGNYRRGVSVNDRWHSHIVDPRTGLPAEQVISATVVTKEAVDAGALATAFNVLHPSESIQLASTIPNLEYMIITKTGEKIISKGWDTIITNGSFPTIQPLQESVATSPADFQPIWDSSFELLINLEMKLQQDGWVKRPYVAVWIEDKDHAPVRTLALWYNKNRWLPELKSWYRFSYNRINATNGLYKSATSATRPPGKYSLKWNGRDDKGNLVKPGKYTVFIEVAREHTIFQDQNSYALIRKEVDCDGTPKLVNLAGNAEIGSASIDYRKKKGAN
jgi:FAD:protein FMN transferase